jgi:hypothetical protein
LVSVISIAFNITKKLNIDLLSDLETPIVIQLKIEQVVTHQSVVRLASALAPFATAVHSGTAEEWIIAHVLRSIEALDVTPCQDARVIVKGCGKGNLGFAAYGQIAARLTPVVKSLMFGEPCSTVPVWKRG